MDKQQLTSRIYDDVQNALTLVEQTREHRGAMVTSVNVRVGERSELVSNLDDLSPDPFSSQNGWIIDLTFTPNNTQSHNELSKTSLFHLVEDLPVTAIKGVGIQWSSVLLENGVSTIAEYSALSWNQLHHLASLVGSSYIFEWYHLVTALHTPFPVAFLKEASEHSFTQLIQQDLGEILLLLDYESQSQSIAGVCAFFAAIDNAILEEITIPLF